MLANVDGALSAWLAGAELNPVSGGTVEQWLGARAPAQATRFTVPALPLAAVRSGVSYLTSLSLSFLILTILVICGCFQEFIYVKCRIFRKYLLLF